MQKVIGLDLGTYSIKAVEIVNQFKSYEITNFYENIVPFVPDVDSKIVVPTVLEEIFKENKLKADRIITAMPGQHVSSRIMSFNFSDPKKIKAAVHSEIEDIAPYNIDDMIIDQQIIGQNEGKTTVLAVMTKKDNMQTFLNSLGRIDIDPRLVDIDSLAFYNLSSTMSLPADEVIALVDCGHEKTSLTIVQNGVLRMFRTINLGGKFLTEFLSRDIEVPYATGQRFKHQISRVIHDHDDCQDLSKEEQKIAKILTTGANAIIKDLGRTLYSFKTYEKKPISLIKLSGGTSKINGFKEYLEQQLEIPVSESRLDETSLSINSDLSEHMATMPQSIAIGMRGISSVKRVSTINLRQGEFAFVQDYEQLFKASTSFAKVLGACFVLLMVCYGLNYFFYQKQSEKIVSLYKKEASNYVSKILSKSEFTDFEKSLKRKKTIKSAKKFVESNLEDDVEAKQVAIADFVETNKGSRAMISLAKVSKAIPEELTLNVTKYHFKTSFKSPSGADKDDDEVKKVINNALVISYKSPNYDIGGKIADRLKAQSFLIIPDDGVTSTQATGSSSDEKSYTITGTFNDQNLGGE